MLNEKPQHRGLNTIEDLNWLGRIRLALRRQSRAFYRSIRHPRNRHRGAVRKWLALKIKNRALWRPTRQSVAAGLGGGIFFAMLPIPLQSFVAAGVGMSRGWNLPAAIAATWISNPLTYVPMILAARGTIVDTMKLFGLQSAAGQMSTEKLVATLDAAAHLHLTEAWGMAGHALLEIVAGMVLLGIVLGILGWIFVQTFWSLGSRLLNAHTRQTDAGKIMPLK